MCPHTRTQVDTLAAAWAVGAYKRLARPYRKNVKHIVLVAPSTMARLLLTLAKPLVSRKADAKVKRVSTTLSALLWPIMRTFRRAIHCAHVQGPLMLCGKPLSCAKTQVSRLQDIPAATQGEVPMPALGFRFLRDARLLPPPQHRGPPPHLAGAHGPHGAGQAGGGPQRLPGAAPGAGSFSQGPPAPQKPHHLAGAAGPPHAH